MQVDRELAEIFEYHFGIDITQPKYIEGRIELADYFKKIVQNSISKGYSIAQLDKPLNVNPKSHTYTSPSEGEGIKR